MKGRAIAFGAVSIVNAIASGKGATAGVRLTTSAEVRIDKGHDRWRVKVNGRESQSNLAIQTVRKVLKHFGREPERFDGLISTKTEIPIGVGLKSSSSASVAIALASIASLGEKKFEEDQVLKLSAEASLASGASVTGAFDDAASCLLGGINHAHNLQRRLVNSVKFEEPVNLVILVPKQRSRRASISVDHVRRFSGLAEVAFSTSLKGGHWEAMTLNGLIYSAVYGYDPSPALAAIGAGALGAGLSGTGPAVASVFRQDKRSSVKTLIREWRALGGSVICTRANNDRARIVEDD